MDMTSTIINTTLLILVLGLLLFVIDKEAFPYVLCFVVGVLIGKYERNNAN